jgi:thiosulfate dehydrogenase [quinone] large subunit
MTNASNTQVPEPSISRFLFSDTRLAILWTIIRVYVGYQWLHAGWGKLTNPAGVWVGDKAGAAVSGFFKGALAKTTGDHPDVQAWYGNFIETIALPNATLFSYLVVFGEILVGAALILGLLTGIAAFFGAFMNTNFLLAGTVSTNPILLVLAIGLILAWRVAGNLGLDRYALPLLGVPGAPGKLVQRVLRPIPNAAD